MQEQQVAHRDIPVDLLVEHPENSNFMRAETSQKLRKHVERTGIYEPLVVRPNPHEEGKFQVINGHNRLRVLRSLNHKMAHCVVWSIDDDQTRLYLATLNRLSGTDVPERRAMLLENLFAAFGPDELASLLPDGEKQIEELRRLAYIDVESSNDHNILKDEFVVPVILTFMVEEAGAREVNLALDFIMSTKKDKQSRSEALVSLAHFYVEQCRSSVEAEVRDE